MENKKKGFFSFFKNSYIFLKNGIENSPFVSERENSDNIPLLIQQRFFEEISQKKSAARVAIFFDMEYIHKSAITDFSLKTFCLFPDRFHVFTRFPKPGSALTDKVLKEISSILNIPRKQLSVFNANNYADMDAHFNYSANIFVLGDSIFNLRTFETAIQLRAHHERNYLYFHDGLYTNLLHAWIIKHHYIWQHFIQSYYPDMDITTGIGTEDLLRKNIRMINPLLQLTGSTKIIVNADNCIPIIKNEVNHKNIHYISAWLPIPDYRNIIPAFNKTETNFVVAHFGIPNAFKHIDILIEAVSLLRQKQNVKLLLAGYGVKKYVQSLSSHEQSFIIYEESPNAEDLLSLMKNADVTVQLRWPTMGQASGIVSEMLGLGMKCITTEGFVNECFRDYVVELPACVSPNALAEAILDNKGKMAIPPKEHAQLLKQFSYSSSANLIYQSVTQPERAQPGSAEKKSTADIEVNRPTVRNKLRILYGASHRVLRFEEVPLFIEAGFEVIPVKAHWEIFRIQEPGADDPAHPLYPNWRETCTIPNAVIEKIQAIDILKYQDLNAGSGRVSPHDAALLNEWIDIIYIPNLLPPVPRVLSWFKGLTLFRVYGEGKIMTYDEWAANSGANLNLLRIYDARYATMLMLYTLNGPEHRSILGTNVFHVGPSVTRSRVTGQWKGDTSSRICNTSLSYIYENPHWTDIYHEFCEVFKDIPLRILGKNNKSHEVLKRDNRVTGIIKNDKAYLDILTDCRCLIDPGTSPFHTHYAPLEAIIMGIPVIFMESSGMAQEIIRVIPKDQLTNCGICTDFSEAKKIMQHCLDDINYAKEVSANQRMIAEKMFSPASVLNQIKAFAEAAPELLTKARALSIDHENQSEESALSDMPYHIAMPATSNAAIAGLIQQSFSDQWVYFMKKLIKKIYFLSLGIIRKTYKVVCPAKYHEKISASLFKTCLPNTHKKMLILQRQADQYNALNAISKDLRDQMLEQPNIGFSQAGEDRIIFFICDYFMKTSFADLVYLDIGANNPKNDNNTYLIYLSHGQGVLVEPNHYWCDEIKKRRPRDTVLNMGISTDDKTTSATYYACDNHGLSTFSPERSEELKADGHTITEIPDVPLISFNQVVETYLNDTAPDFVSLDVEGLELGILKSINWEKYRPKIFCIESNMESFKTGHPNPVLEWMEAKNYLCVANTSINFIFVSQETFHHKSNNPLIAGEKSL
ncbi:MAG TPA: FkbM family methyltransferase [Gammaproteobacteria bacterium]|nr:FkbM family methyltransferase [Gammaproteobacteria bacterium]